MRPLEYGIVDQSEDNGFENDDSSQRRPSSSAGHRRQRFPSVRAWILFGAVVAIGGVAIIRKMKSQQPVNNKAEDDDLQSPGNSLASSGAENEIAGNGSAQDKVVDEDEDENDTDAPTPVPVALQDITATETTTSGQACDKLFDCISDRLGQNESMFAGQAICSRDGRYAFAMQMDNSVSLVWKNCATGETKKYYRKGEADDYFIMDENAKFAVYGGEGQLKWEKDCLVSVKRYPQCLSKPMYDCPYLHLHRGGVVVLNYIDGWDWISRNIKKMYDF